MHDEQRRSHNTRFPQIKSYLPNVRFIREDFIQYSGVVFYIAEGIRLGHRHPG